jgi:hypothetical protein
VLQPTWRRKHLRLWPGVKPVELMAVALVALVMLATGSTAAANISPCSLRYSPNLLAVGQDGTAYIDETLQWFDAGGGCARPSGDIIVKRTRGGSTSVISGKPESEGPPVPGKAIASPVYEPFAATVDAHGNLFVAQVWTSAVLKITPAGRLTVVAGEIGKRGRPLPGKAANSRLNFPSALALDAKDNLYIADSGNDVVEKVTREGQLSIFAGRVRRVGPPSPGPAVASTLSGAGEIAVDPAGDVYVASGQGEGNGRYVSEITPNGNLSVVAGDGASGVPRRGAPALRSPLGKTTRTGARRRFRALRRSRCRARDGSSRRSGAAPA